MKRIVAIACVAALAGGLTATFAYAATVNDFAGQVNRGGKIKFSTLRNNHGYTRAGLFAFRKIPVRCRGGKTAKVFFSTDNAVDVKRRKFSYGFHFGSSGTGRVRGRFLGRGNRARGIVNVVSLDPNGPRGDRKDCTTNGPRGWTAKKR
jgi:hypothetical protein